MLPPPTHRQVPYASSPPPPAPINQTPQNIRVMRHGRERTIWRYDDLNNRMILEPSSWSSSEEDSPHFLSSSDSYSPVHIPSVPFLRH